MRIRTIWGQASLFGLISIALIWFPILAADPAKSSRPPKFQLADEPLLTELSAAKAVEFLDAGAQATENGKCVNCHASFAYLMARPMLSLDTKRHAEVRSDLEKWVEYLEGLNLDTNSDSRRRAEAVMSAAVLAQHDAATTGKLHSATRQALDLVWRVQLPEGGFDWLKPNNEPPSAIDNHFGATMAAIAVGTAPEDYSETPHARAGTDKLRAYFASHPPSHMHQRGMLLLADQAIGGLLSEEARQQTVAEFFELQRPDGGWAMASLGDKTWKRKDKKPQDFKTSDGYGTGFSVYVLCTAGQVPATDPRIRKAVDWLTSHQRASGGWYTRSPKKGDALSSYVGTVYAVLALKACGALP
jgi:squalene-hopene/tetraprenyl-beta-curcumene cyclase